MSVDTESRVPSARVSGWLQRRLRSRVPIGPVDPPPRTPEPPRLPGRRNPKWIALGIVAICLGGLLSYVIYARVATETTVVALAQTVYRGQVVTADDLATVTLNGDPGVATVPAEQRDQLVGKRARYDLVEGAILPDGAIADVVLPQDDRALVGVKLSAGRAPGPHLLPGSTVRLIAVPPVNAEAGFRDEYTGKTFPARIVDQGPGPDAASILVNVDVSADQAPVVALLASQDRLSVVRDADR